MICLRKRRRRRAFFREWEVQRLDGLSRRFDRLQKCQAFSAEEQRLYRQLEYALPPECKPLLIRYSDMYIDLLTLQQQYFYRHGFRDGRLFP